MRVRLLACPYTVLYVRFMCVQGPGDVHVAPCTAVNAWRSNVWYGARVSWLGAIPVTPTRNAAG